MLKQTNPWSYVLTSKIAWRVSLPISEEFFIEAEEASRTGVVFGLAVWWKKELNFGNTLMKIICLETCQNLKDFKRIKIAYFSLR